MFKKLVSKIKTVWPNLVYLKYKKSVRPLYRVLRPYYILQGTWPVWFNIVNRKARKLYEENKKPLDTAQQRVVGELKENGIAITHLDELFPGQNLLPQLQKFAEGLIDNKHQREKGKTYIADLWEKMNTVDLSNPFIKLTLSPKVVGIANGYLDMYSKFYMYNLNLVLPVGSAEPISSQRWHRDPEDKKLCKIFIYLSDVDAEAGPLSYFARSNSGGRWGNLFPQKPPHGSININENAIKRLAQHDGIKVAMGRAGTVIFGDTAGIHMGGYAKSKQRLMFTGGFCSAASLWLPQFVYPNDSELEKLSDHASRYALQPWY